MKTLFILDYRGKQIREATYINSVKKGELKKYK